MARVHFLPVPDDTTDTERLRIDAEFMRGVLASSDDCIKVLDLDANLIFMSEGGQRVMEVSDFNLIKGCPWPDFWQDQGNIDAKEAVRIAKAGGSGRFQGAANTAAGTPRYWDVQVTPILGPDGRPEQLLSISRDITELKRAQDSQHFLMQELGHRMKNMLALVQAISSQTFRGEVPFEEAREAFSSRLVTLARTQDVLLGGAQHQTGIGALLDVVEHVHTGKSSSRIARSGPEIMVGSKAAVSLSLALHELATNAIKYGALSNETGRVSADWGWTGADGDRFWLSWEEKDGPKVAPPTKTGFGSRMIRRILEQDGVTAETSYLPDGVVFRIDAPRDFLAG